MRLNKICCKIHGQPPAEQTIFSHAYQPLISYLEVIDRSLLNQ